MGRARKFKGTDAEIALARFLCGITDDLGLDTVDKVAERFPQCRSRSKWAEYLNGAKLIPKPLLRDVLQELLRTRSDSWSGHTLVEANKLWKNAAEGTPTQGSSSSELLSLYRRLTDTAEALNKAKTVAANSERVIPLLLQFAGRQEMKVAELTHEVESLREKERAEAAYRLEQAQFRLTRVQTELERARSDRYTAEQAQAVLMREQQEARREIARLQQTAPDLDHQAEVIEPTLLPDHTPEPQMSEEEIDCGIDQGLDDMGADREQRGAMLSEVLGQAGMELETEREDPRTIPGTVVSERSSARGPVDQETVPERSEDVQGLSWTTPDNPATSNDILTLSPATSPKQRNPLHLSGWLARALLLTLLTWGISSAGPFYDGTSKKPDSSNTPTNATKDPVVEVGVEEVNTPKIMALPDCADSPADSVNWSVELKPDPPTRGGEAAFEATLERADSAACRFNLNRHETALTVYAFTPDGRPVVAPLKGGLWSSQCSSTVEHRWARLDSTGPIKLVYNWDFQRQTTQFTCGTSPIGTFDEPGHSYEYSFCGASFPQQHNLCHAGNDFTVKEDDDGTTT